MRTGIVSKTDTTFVAESGKTRNEIADDLKWSSGKVTQSDIVWKKAEEDPQAKSQRQIMAMLPVATSLQNAQRPANKCKAVLLIWSLSE